MDGLLDVERPPSLRSGWAQPASGESGGGAVQMGAVAMLATIPL